MKKEMKIVLPFYKIAYAVSFVVILSLIRGVVVVLRAKCKNVANKMQKIGFKKRHFKRLLNAK